jgi:WD40 repeat protein
MGHGFLLPYLRPTDLRYLMNKNTQSILTWVAITAMCALSACTGGANEPNTTPGWTLEMRAGLTNIDSSFFTSKGINIQTVKGSTTSPSQSNILQQLQSQVKTLMPNVLPIATLVSQNLKAQDTAGIATSVFVAIRQNAKAPSQNIALTLTGPDGKSEPWTYKAGDFWESTSLAGAAGAGTYSLQGTVPDGKVIGSAEVKYLSSELLPAFSKIAAFQSPDQIAASWAEVREAKSYLSLVYDTTLKKYVAGNASTSPKLLDSTFKAEPGHEYTLDVIASTVDITKDTTKPYSPAPTVARSAIFSQKIVSLPETDLYEQSGPILVAQAGTKIGSLQILAKQIQTPLRLRSSLEGNGLELVSAADTTLFPGESHTLQVRGTCSNNQDLTGTLLLNSNSITQASNRIPVVIECSTVTGSARLEQTMLSHQWPISAVVTQPNGPWLVTSDQHVLNLWNTASGAFVRTLPPTPGITSVAWNPQGNKLAVLSGGNLHVYDPSKNTYVSGLTSEFGSTQVAGIAWSPDGQQLVIGGLDREARLYSASTARLIKSLFMPYDAKYAGASAPSGVAWSAQGALVVYDEAFIRFFDPITAAVSASIAQGSSIPVVFNTSGTRMLTADTSLINGDLRIWDTTSRSVLRSIAITNGSRRSAAVFNPNGTSISMLIDHGTGANQYHLGEYPIDPNGTYSEFPVGFSQGFTWVADGTTVIVQYDRLAEAFSSVGTALRRYGLHQGRLNDVAWKPDSSAILSGSDIQSEGPGEWRIHSLNGLDAAATQTEAPIQAVKWRNNNEFLTVADTFGRKQIQTYTNGTLSTIYTGSDASVYSPDGNKLAISDQNRTVRVVNIQTGASIVTLNASSAANVNVPQCCDKVMGMAWNATSDALALVAGTSVQRFDLNGTRTWEQNTPEILNQVFWQGNKVIATNNNFGSFVLQAKDGGVIAKLIKIPGYEPITVLAAHPNGRVLLGQRQGKLLLLQATSLRVIHTQDFPWNFGISVKAAWSPDGNRFVISDGDRRYEVYQYTP